MAQVKDIHIIDLEKNLIDRLQMVNLAPKAILNIGVEEEVIKKLYPGANIVKKERADVILAAIRFSENVDVRGLLKDWRSLLKPCGLLLFGFSEIDLDIHMLGDLMVQLGFINVVIDHEDNVVYGHAVGPKEVSVKINQIRRIK